VAEPNSHSFETPGRVRVRVEIPAGVVRVEPWSEPRVEIDVAAARNDARSTQAAADSEVTASERGGRHEIVVRAPKRRGPELAVTIRCPDGTDLDHATHSADLEAHGRLGAVSARSASGDVALGATEALIVQTASGDITAGAVAGSLTTKSASGDLDVRSIGETGSVGTVSGDIRIGETRGALAVKTVSGDVELEAVGASVRVGSVSGDIEIGAIPGLVLWIDAQSVSGTMTSELDVGDDPAAAGEEAVELRVRTVSGDVRVARSAVPAR